MKKITLSLLILIHSINGFCQSNWTLSMTGYDQTYSPADFVTTSNGDVYVNGVKYDNGISGYVNKLYRSTNQGTSWTEVSTTGLTNLGNVHSLTISGNKMILGGMDVNSANGAKIFISELPATTITHTVHFNANGGSGTMPDQSSSTSTTLNFNTFTRAGYTFTSWNTVANGSGTSYADGSIYSFSDDVTLYAQWSEVVLGIETQSAEKILFYPNPASGNVLNLKSDKQISNVLLFNVHGQLVKIENTSTNDVSISIKDLPVGLYFVNARLINGSVCVVKLIKE